jgi:hypothetical protein
VLLPIDGLMMVLPIGAVALFILGLLHHGADPLVGRLVQPRRGLWRFPDGARALAARRRA